MRAWLARVHHDLIKRLLWPARDRRELGGDPAAGELVPRLIDEEGRPISAQALWKSLCDEVPPGASSAALAAFAQQLHRAVAAAERGDVDGVLGLDGAFRAFSAALNGNGKDG
jgi:hypothetical protein